MRALHPNVSQNSVESLCEPCVHYGKKLDPSYFPPPAPQHVCGLGFTAGDDCCAEMRTNNCSARKS